MRTLSPPAFVAILLIVSCWATAAPAKDNPRRSLVIREAQAKLGELLQGSKARAVFALENTGTAPLQIEKVIPGCGCLRVLRHPKTIAPGAKEKVEVEIDTSHLTPGPQAKSVEIRSNDYRKPNQLITVMTQVMPLFRFAKLPLQLTALPGQAIEERIRLVSAIEEPFEVIEVNSHHGKVTVELQHGDTGPALRVRATAHPTVATFADGLEVTVKMASGETRMAEIPVFVEFRDRVQVDPRLLSFRRSDTAQLRKTGSSVVKTVRVVTEETDFRFQLQNASIQKAPPGAFRVSWKALEEGRSYEVRIELLKYLKVRTIRCPLVLETDDPTTPVRKIWVSAHFPR